MLNPFQTHPGWLVLFLNKHKVKEGSWRHVAQRDGVPAKSVHLHEGDVPVSEFDELHLLGK